MRDLLQLHSTVSSDSSVEPDDIVKTKAVLNASGQYPLPADGFTNFTDAQMFEGLRTFQRQNGLESDGVMTPVGPTATAINQGLARTLEQRAKGLVPVRDHDTPAHSATPEECDHLYYKVDVPTCNAITARRGRRAGGRCHHSAAFRYALCLRGVPIDNLPPLDTWNN